MFPLDKPIVLRESSQPAVSPRSPYAEGAEGRRYDDLTRAMSVAAEAHLMSHEPDACGRAWQLAAGPNRCARQPGCPPCACLCASIAYVRA